MKPGSKWKRRLLAAVVAFVSLLALSPILVTATPLRHWLLARALPGFPGSIHIGRASMGWFRPPIFRDIELRDSAGRILLHVPQLQGNKSLAALLCHPFDLGEFRLTQPVLHIVCSHESSNLETVLAYWLQKPRKASEKAAFALDGIAIRAELEQARIVLEDEDRGRHWSLDPLDLTVDIPRDRRTPLHLEAKAAAQLGADLSVHFVETAGVAPRLRGEGELRAEGLPLDAAEPFLRRFHPHIELGGRLHAHLKLRPGDGQAGSPDVRLEGNVSLNALTLHDSLLGPDTLRLQQVQAPLRLALGGSRLAIEQLQIQSEVGKIGLGGTMDLVQDLRASLIQPGHRIDAELNLARLAALIPNALHLTKDTRVQSGALSLHLRSDLREDGVHWQGDLHTSDLQGLYQGQRVTWKEPFAVVLTAQQDSNDPLPVLERFRCDSDFLRLEMSGSPRDWTARGSFNLGRLREHLAGFVELGSLRLQGEGTLRAAARYNPHNGYRLESDVGLSQFCLAGGARTWREDSLTVHLDLVGDLACGCRIDAAAMHVLAGKDGIDVDLLEPPSTLPPSSSSRFRARLRLHGDLARWQGRIASLTGLLDGMSLAGQIDADGRLRYEAETIHLEDVKIAGRSVGFQGYGLNANEPVVDFTTSGRWLPERETLELQHTRLSCPSVTVQAPAVTLSADPLGAWLVTASATVQGDVARLQKIPCLRGGLVGGALAGRVDLRPDQGRQIVQWDANVQNLLLGSPTSPLWRESRVNVSGHGVYDSVKDSVQIVQLHLDSPTASCDGSGQLNASRAGSVSDGLAVACVSCVSRSTIWNGDAVLRCQALQALGCRIGPAELRGQWSNGRIQLAPIEATLNQGRLHLEPRVVARSPDRATTGELPMELTLAKGRVIDRAHLSPLACASALGYAVPVLAGVVQADGEFSLDLHSARLPLMEPAKGDVIGWCTLHSAQVSAGPLVQELSVLLNGPATLTLAKDNIVPFRMIDGRVYHTGLELRFPELTIHTSGSVGLDGSLALTAEMPVPPKWLGSSKLAKSALAKQTIRLPIGGTLSHPKIDERALSEASAKFLRNAVGDALPREMDGKVKNEVEKGLRKLFRRKSGG